MQFLNRLFIFVLLVSPIALVISIFFLATGGMNRLIIGYAITLAIVIFIPTPQAAIINRQTAWMLLLVSLLPVLGWVVVLALSSPEPGAIEIVLRAILAVMAPIAVCTKWSMAHIIGIGHISGCGMYAHLLPAACEQSVLRGPLWVYEAREIEPVLRPLTASKYSIVREEIETLLGVLSLIILSATAVVFRLLSNRAFTVVSSDKEYTPEIPDRGCLMGNFALASLAFFTSFVSS